MQFLRRWFAELGRCPSRYAHATDMELRCDGRYGHYTPHCQLIPYGETTWPNHEGEWRRQMVCLGMQKPA